MHVDRGWETKLTEILTYQNRAYNMKARVFNTNLVWEKKHCSHAFKGDIKNKVICHVFWKQALQNPHPLEYKELIRKLRIFWIWVRK